MRSSARGLVRMRKCRAKASSPRASRPGLTGPAGAHTPIVSPGRSAGGDILAGLRALTFDPLVGGARMAGGALASVMPQGLKDGAKKGADAFKDGLMTGAGAVKGGLVKTGDAIASAMPQELRDGLAASAAAAQRGALVALEAAQAGAMVAKDVAEQGAGVVISVLPQEFKDVAAVSREAVEKLAEAGRAVERLLKDKAWRNMNSGGQKKGKKARRRARPSLRCAPPRADARAVRCAALLQLLPRAPRLRARVRRASSCALFSLGVLICSPAALFRPRSSCTFFGAIMLMRDPNPPDNIVDSIFMTVRAAAPQRSHHPCPRSRTRLLPHRFPPCPARA